MAARGQRFAWGGWDCALFAADVVDARCASRLAARWRGRYRTARGARGVLRRAGGIEAVMAEIGRAVPVRLAQRGDVVLLPAAAAGAESAGLMLAVCLGERLAGAGPGGLGLVHLDHGTAVMAGALEIPGYERRRRDYLACAWLPPKWDWIDPLKDARADIEQIEAGLKSRTQALAERGYDAEQVDAEIAADRAREERLGLSFTASAAATPDPVPEPPPEPATAGDAPDAAGN